MIRIAGLAVATLAPLLLGSVSADDGPAAMAFRLDVPIRCRFGRNCAIQQYPDHDPGPAAVDYRCGPMSYEGHDGTDFRVTTAADQRSGVAVLAAAAGVVRGMRDGMEDRDVRIRGKGSVKGRECGNGATIAHSGGWETQYCHLAKGSVRVTSGQRVASGSVLGLVGESGDAAFPHLHLAVRRAGITLDPFSGTAIAARCGAGHSLWSAAAVAALPYRSPDLLDAGFAGRALTMTEAQDGPGRDARPTGSGAAFVAYARLIGLKAGDRPRITLYAADGHALATNMSPPMQHDRAEHFLFAGARREGARWPAGRYRARIEVLRGDGRVLDHDVVTTIA